MTERKGLNKMNKELMDLCDKFLRDRIEKRDMPHDFDDITWVMHDFFLWMKKHEHLHFGHPDNAPRPGSADN